MVEEPDELSGLELLLPLLLLLPGDELLPEELPELVPDELPSEPPIPELGLTPKYENTLCFQPGCDRSVVASKDGADCNLLVSPLKANVCWPMLEAVLDVPELALLELLGRNNVQGTATCLPEPELEPLLELSPLELVPLELVPLELVPLVLLPGDELAPDELLPDELSEMIAHSILPEAGLKIASLTVPNVSPEVDCTCEPVSWLTLISRWPNRPVALSPLLELPP